MGQTGRGWTTHCEMRYTGVRVPRDNVLGEPGDGFRIAQKRLGPGRIHHCMRWLGQMQRAFELMCSYALERQVGGAPLAEKQTVQNWIADSAAGIQACRLLTLSAAQKIDEGDEARVEISLIKFYAARGAARRDRPRDPGARRAAASPTRPAARARCTGRPAPPASTTARTRCTGWSSAAGSSTSFSRGETFQLRTKRSAARSERRAKSAATAPSATTAAPFRPAFNP